MRKTVLYKYLGTNGTILSPIHLEDVYYVREIRLIADKYKILKNIETGSLQEAVVIPESELEQWIEIDQIFSEGQD